MLVAIGGSLRLSLLADEPWLTSLLDLGVHQRALDGVLIHYLTLRTG
jgi:hypothetical protein